MYTGYVRVSKHEQIEPLNTLKGHEIDFVSITEKKEGH
jgi:hypothetical protein